MQRQPTPKRTCLACRSGDYPFRNLEKAEGGKGEAAQTKYCCKACAREWRVRVPE